RSAPLPARIEAISAATLGARYGLDPLGEGVPPDPDPLARYDLYDCQTWVEEILSLSLALDPVDAGRIRASLRYGDAAPSYATRRHFTELQWLPGIIADGWVVDATARYGVTRALRAEVTAATWRSWPDRSRFPLPDEALPTGTMALDILPVDAAIEAAPRLAPGSVILLVREPKPGIPIWTTHMGVLVSGGALRHASLTHHEVRDQPLADYLRAARRWSWPVAGIAVLEPQEQAPRR
ncbi:MAG TPA: DUF1460 domain-containing protein, partial [Myxococcota bacterium]|nr:DUF1460 domain-containing protein [Myxococcota bacterium]